MHGVISGNKGFGDSGYEFSLCMSLEKMGGNLAPSLSSFSLESFYEFLQVFVSTYSDGFYISLCISRV